MPPPPKRRGAIQIKIMEMPSRTPPRSPSRTPLLRIRSPAMLPQLPPLDDLSPLSRGGRDDDGASASGETEDDEKAEEELQEAIDTFKHQMHQIYVASAQAQEQVARLLTRTKEEAAEVQVRPLRPKPAVVAWLEERGEPTDPSLEEFMELCLEIAEAKDLGARTLLFSAADAAVLTGGRRRVTVFDMLRLIPALFE